RNMQRQELAAARSDVETWRSRAEERAGTIIDLRARWDSVSRLSTAQALLFGVGGLLVGPALQDAVGGQFSLAKVLLAVLGLGAIGAAVLLGRIGPKREQ